MSQKELADFSTLSIRAIRDLENGRVKTPRRETVQLLGSALGLSPSQGAEFGGTRTAEAAIGAPFLNGALLGREDELKALTILFHHEHRRLITLTGIEGVGKTHLALEFTRDFETSSGAMVRWISGNGNASTPLPAPARQMEIRTLAAEIAERPALVVADGWSYGADPLIRLLADCPAAQVLVTARKTTGAIDESLFPLGPLPVPNLLDLGCGLQESDRDAFVCVDSVRMFLARMRQSRPSLRLETADAVTAVATICRALDGLPAALEQAARWLLVYSPEQLADLLAADPACVARESGAWETLHETVWSLTLRQQTLLRATAARTAWWTVAEAADLAGIDVRTTASEVSELLMLGLLRRADEADPSTFSVLGIVRRLLDANRVPQLTRS